MLASAHIYRTAAAVAALSVTSGYADDARNIAQAQSACIQMAKEHLAKLAVPGEPTFGDAANVSSDPVDDAFEFRWLAADRTLQWRPPEAGKALVGVFCRGNASKKIITSLIVGNDTLKTPRSY